MSRKDEMLRLGFTSIKLTFLDIQQKVKLRHIKKKLISESPERYRVKVKIKKKSPPSDVIFTKVKVRLYGIIRWMRSEYAEM